MANILPGFLKFLFIGCGYVLSTILSAPIANAQQLSGIVRGEEGNRLPGVHVAIAELNLGTITDDDGAYALRIPEEGEYLVSFSFIGFRTHTESISVPRGNLELNVSLVTDIVESDEVLVEVDRFHALTRNSRSVSVLDPEDLVELRGQNLGETLEQLPGVTTLQTGPSISKPVVRGLHSQRVLVLNAGVSQEGQQWGGEHAPEIDPFAPVRIEVVKGVAGVEYGVGAIGGVIRLEPLELPHVPGQGVGGQLSLNGFSNNLQGAGALYVDGTSSRWPGFGWRVQGSFRKAGDTHTPDYVVRNSAFEEFNGSVSAGIHRENTHILAHYSHFGTELGIYTGAHIGNINDLLRAIERGQPSVIGQFGYDIENPKQVIAHDLFSLHGDHRLPAGHVLEAQYGFQVNHRQEFDAHGRNTEDSADLPAFDLSLISHSLELKFQHNPVGNWVGVVGVSGMNQLNRNDASGFLIPNFRALSGGIFARESWTKEHLTIEAGARFDYRWVRAWPRETGAFVRRITDYASLSSVVGAIWQFAPTWSLGANLGTGWRPPSVNELYNFGVHHGTAQFEIGNPDLGAERSVGLDATLRHDSPNSRLELSVYSNRFDRFIYLFPDEEPRVTIRGTFPTFRYRQADAVIRGFDAAFEHDFRRVVTLGLQTSFLRGDNLDTDEPLFLMPGDRLMGSVEFHLGSSGRFRDSRFEIENLLVRKQTRFPVNADYADPPDGYVLWNAGFSTRMQMARNPVRFNLSVQNLFDTVYRDYLSRFRYFIDDPGRSIILRVQIPLGAAERH